MRISEGLTEFLDARYLAPQAQHDPCRLDESQGQKMRLPLRPLELLSHFLHSIPPLCYLKGDFLLAPDYNLQLGDEGLLESGRVFKYMYCFPYGQNYSEVLAKVLLHEERGHRVAVSV